MKSPISPYQPVLLRLLHNAIALLVFSALITGYIIYDRFDKRWGSLNLPTFRDPQGLHGTIALAFWILLPIFGLYCFHIGDRHLVRKDSFTELKNINKPIWWISLHRLTNTLTLVSATLAVVTGRMMKEQWLPNQELDHVWYYGHLLSWLLMIVSIAFHLLMSVKIGGLPLLLSMLKWQIQAKDTPKSWFRKFKIKPSSTVLFIFEFFVIGGIVIAVFLPVISQS